MDQKTKNYQKQYNDLLDEMNSYLDKHYNFFDKGYWLQKMGPLDLKGLKILFEEMKDD